MTPRPDPVAETLALLCGCSRGGCVRAAVIAEDRTSFLMLVEMRGGAMFRAILYRPEVFGAWDIEFADEPESAFGAGDTPASSSGADH